MMQVLGVSFGAPNKWKVEDDGSFTPEFMTPEYMQVLDLLKRLYDEKLLNQDFAVFDSTEAEKKYDSGVVGIRMIEDQLASALKQGDEEKTDLCRKPSHQ